MIRLNRVAAVALIASACGGCQLEQWAHNGFKVGPNYEAAPAALSDTWVDYTRALPPPATAPGAPAPSAIQPGMPAATQPAVSVSFAKWWSVFNDPVLDNLIHDTYGQNLTLKQAGERIVQVRALRDIAVGNLFPQSQYVSGSHTVNKQSDRVSNGGPFTDQWFQNVNAGVNVGWEIDFWGRYRRALESSDAALDASVANYDDVMVLLLAQTASTYIQYRTFQERLFLAKQNVEIQRQGLELAQNKNSAGAATERDVSQSRQVYEQTRSLIPTFEQGLLLANNRLCVLLGLPVQDLSPRLGETGFIPVAPPEVMMGIPADLLRRRPDVRRAERLAAVQSAQIGIAQADLYPRFAINGSIGLSAEYIGGLWHTPGSMFGSLGPSFRWDILNYGRIENAVAAQEASFRLSVLNYQDAVLQANREAEDAIITFAKSKEREVFLTQSVTAAERTVQITYDQYRLGAVDFTPVFIFELTLTQQQDALAESRGDIAQSLVDLYRSLGGGWEARLQPEGVVGPPAPAPTTQRAPTRPDLLPPSTRPAAR